jgi:hypothetical protein
MKTYITILSAFILLASCQREADIELPKTEPKLSVSCFISDDIDTIRVSVFWSRPVFSSENNLPERPIDIDVLIKSGPVEKNLIWDENLLQYVLPVSEFPLVAGGQYELILTAPNGTRIRGNTTIPIHLPEVESTQLLRDSSITSWGETQYKFTFKTFLRDPSSSFNRYRFVYYEFFSFEGLLEQELYRGQSFLDDESLINGRLYEETVVDYFGYNINPADMVMYVINASEEYDRFHRSLENQSDGNPFAEPALIYSNFENGLGVFAGYRQTRVTY